MPALNLSINILRKI